METLIYTGKCVKLCTLKQLSHTMPPKGRHASLMCVTQDTVVVSTVILCLSLVVENDVMLLSELYHNKSAIATKGLCHFLVIEALSHRKCEVKTPAYVWKENKILLE